MGTIFSFIFYLLIFPDKKWITLVNDADLEVAIQLHSQSTSAQSALPIQLFMGTAEAGGAAEAVLPPTTPRAQNTGYKLASLVDYRF